MEVPEYISTLIPYPPGKPIEELEREYGVKNPIKLASNENPFGPSPRAQEAIQHIIPNLHRYPDGSGYYLKNALAKKYQVNPGNIVLGNGSNELIDFLVRVFVREGDEVISSHPSFLVYQKMVQIVGGKNVVLPLTGFTHDLDAISNAVSERTRLIFLDNPNNPTGTVISREAFETFLDHLPQGLLVVLDEAYGEYVRGDYTPRGQEYIGRDKRVVTLRTFSKAYGLAGLRVGFGLMDEEIAGLLERVRQPFNVNAVAQVAALAALDDAEHLDKTLENTWSEAERMKRSLEDMGCEVLPGHTNFMLIRIKRDAVEIYKKMLKKGVIIRAMNSYDLPDYIRITIGLPEENDRFLEALQVTLNDAEAGV